MNYTKRNCIEKLNETNIGYKIITKGAVVSGKSVKKVKQEKIILNEKNIKKALCKKALGFSIDEITEEYGADEGSSLKLVKRKVITKQIPPDLSALKILFEYENRETDFSKLSDEELLSEKEKLLKKIKEELIEDECEEG